MYVLFICSGNVARSQEAAAYLKLLRPDLHIESAGTKAIIGKPINPDVLTVTAEDGLDLKAAYRKQLDLDTIRRADYLVSFVDAKELPRYTEINEFWDVPDPRDGTLELHRRVRDDIKARVTALAAALI